MKYTMLDNKTYKTIETKKQVFQSVNYVTFSDSILRS